jgi:hypothetical protein
LTEKKYVEPSYNLMADISEPKVLAHIENPMAVVTILARGWNPLPDRKIKENTLREFGASISRALGVDARLEQFVLSIVKLTINWEVWVFEVAVFPENRFLDLCAICPSDLEVRVNTFYTDVAKMLCAAVRQLVSPAPKDFWILRRIDQYVDVL